VGWGGVGAAGLQGGREQESARRRQGGTKQAECCDQEVGGRWSGRYAPLKGKETTTTTTYLATTTHVRGRCFVAGRQGGVVRALLSLRPAVQAGGWVLGRKAWDDVRGATFGRAPPSRGVRWLLGAVGGRQVAV